MKKKKKKRKPINPRCKPSINYFIFIFFRWLSLESLRYYHNIILPLAKTNEEKKNQEEKNKLSGNINVDILLLNWVYYLQIE